MGSMSTSDAAPLPRLGEVFFDVRSASRSLRVSWYADTGVAVLSIWQGGTCTGSFRLPMADLPRMIETLQRGPDGLAASGEGWLPPADEPARTGAAGQDGYPAGSGSLHYLNGPPAGEYQDQAAPGPAHYPSPPGQAPYQDQPTAAYYPDTFSQAGYPDQPGAAPYPDQMTTPRHPDSRATARYPDQGAGYPADPGHQDMAAGPPRGRYPNPAGHGLEPLPESFPYSQLLPDHELR